MKYVKTFEDFQVSEGFRYHMDNGIDITNSVYRLGSDAYKKLFEETKKYWDEGNIILNGKAAWMAKNLEIGKKAIYKGRKVELDTPKRGGNKKFIVYRNSGKVDEKGNIIAKKIEWGDASGLSIKNDDPEAAASFWARHQCDLEKKMDPDTAGFWACYGPSLFSTQLGLQSDEPW
ncbi:hypothetical protein EBU94_00835 [bacterium]|nr:hypothetical protein [bacterium]